ncbi:LLM class flavin-dependent oxidoreductase [Bosea sp. RCC_152_1]|uniref:LLM class flavin-dependent oxidoreductase n=1 Tax=Bosea sp. RCC_152_1 TaxID=3239228 RepID=UPI0035243678
MGLRDRFGHRHDSRSSAGAAPRSATIAVALRGNRDLPSRIGLVGTASTSYPHPFHVARLFASLDLIRGGRAAWNQVTSITDLDARNFDRDKRFTHADRDARAREFAHIVRWLWNHHRLGSCRRLRADAVSSPRRAGSSRRARR